MTHATHEQLEAGLPRILESPKQEGPVLHIVRRPAVDEREVLQEAELSVAGGLVGDSWATRHNKRSPEGKPDPATQLTLMNARVIELLASERGDWGLAGDQFYVDFDLGEENLPVGTQLQIGTARIEVSPVPHTGCLKFVERFGRAAMEFVNSPEGRKRNLRGVNATVLEPGLVRAGDRICRV